ncbi:MAG: hypothetical protein IID08_05900 [Candidatus Hydrogenedentes bacterium]|nr:hypothetical protein [Candidatus Hydrogenedentota bacterium]
MSIQPRRSIRSRTDHVLHGKVAELTRKVHRLELLNQAIWELVRDRMNLSEQEIESKVKEIDQRDGIADDRISEIPLKCPSCGRVSSSRFWKCLYCGQEFERNVLG